MKIADTLTRQLIDVCLQQVKKQKNKDIIEKHIVNPTLDQLMEKLQPFIIGTVAYFVVVAVLLLALLALLLMPRIYNSNG